MPIFRKTTKMFLSVISFVPSPSSLRVVAADAIFNTQAGGFGKIFLMRQKARCVFFYEVSEM